MRIRLIYFILSQRDKSVYSLTLTKAERQAINWVGNRYRHGDELADILIECMDEDIEYFLDGDDNDITFNIPEYDAWDINRIGDECNYQWDCFSPQFAAKMTSFCMGIV